MCGIFGYAGQKPKAAEIVLNGLKSLEYRGYDSWGIAVVTPPHGVKKHEITQKYPLVIKKKAGQIGKAHVDDMPKSSFGFGHTRWATHGGVTDINAHPHLDCTKKIALIHNGIIENFSELKKILIKQGHKFITDTDTEVAVHLIEEYAKTSVTSKAVQKAFKKIKGLNAFIVLSTQDHQLIAVRNGSPLVVGFGVDQNFLASDASALLPYTKQVYYLEDDEMVVMDDQDLKIFNVRSGDRISPRKQKLDWTIEQTVKGKYPFFMLKEIYEQPAILADIAANYSKQAEKIAQFIKKSYGAYLTGCGTAAYACMAGAYFFSKISGRHVNWAIASEFAYQLDFLTEKSFVLALSQSGETMDTLEAVKCAKEKKATIYSLVNVLGSTLYRVSDYKMLIGAGPEKGVASTKAFTGKLAHLLLLSYAIKGDIKEGQRLVTQASIAVKNVLKKNNVELIKKLAQKIKNVSDIYVIGRGLSYTASLETALKIKEVSYIHAEGLAAGELKHGPLALIEKGVPCIVFLPNDETYEANLAGAMEMKARGGFIIGISYKPHEAFDYFIPIDDVGIASIIPNVVIGQLLGYELAVARGHDPDKPRNLAKSVTVK